MGTVNINLAEAQNLNLPLGLQLENEVTEVVFDFSAWKTAYGSGDLGLSIQRPGDSQPYAGELTIDGTDATWTVSSLDIAYKGVGEIQLTYTVGTVVKKSVIYKFTVYKSLGANGKYPSPGQTWQEGIEDDIEGLRADLSEYEQIFTADVGESVSNWLDEHPEATTTVQDGSLTESKFSEALKLQTILKNNVPIFPTMYGEYMGSNYSKTEAFDCVAIHNGLIYAFEQIANDLNNSYVKIFNISTNLLVDTKTINGGHCNSVCVYNDQFYLVPSFVYDGTTPSAVNEIRIFNTSLSLVSTINTPTQPMGVSYDDAEEILYYFDYAKDIYRYENGAFSKVVSTGLATLDNKASYNQDFCVNNGIFYVSSPSGKVMYGDVQTGTLFGGFELAHSDNFGIYMLGETEGFEFFNGVLYVAWYSTTPNGLVSFLLKYDINNKESLRVIYGVRSFGDIYVADDYKSHFKLNQNQIHSLEMLYLITAKYKWLNLGGTYTCDGETFHNFELYLNNKTLNAKNVRVMGLVGVHGTGTINLLANNTFNCVDGVIRFMGTITITSDDLTTATLLTMGTARPISAFATTLTTSLTLKIGSSTLNTPGFYFGENKVI